MLGMPDEVKLMTIKNRQSKVGRLNALAAYIRKNKSVTVFKVALEFNLCQEYAKREFANIGELFPDIVYDGKTFKALAD